MLWTAVVVCSGLVVAWKGATEIVESRARDEVLRRGSLVGGGVARLSIDPLILGDDVTLDLVVGAALHDDPAIRYIGIEDEHGAKRAYHAVQKAGDESGGDGPEEILEARIPIELGGEVIGLVRIGLSSREVEAVDEVVKSHVLGLLPVVWMVAAILGVVGVSFLVGGVVARTVQEIRTAIESGREGELSETIGKLKQEEETCKASLAKTKKEESSLREKAAQEKATLEQLTKELAEAEKRTKQITAQQERLVQETEARTEEYQKLTANVEKLKQESEELRRRLEDERHHQEVLLRRRAGLKESIERLSHEYGRKAGQAGVTSASPAARGVKEETKSAEAGEEGPRSPADVFKGFKKESKLRRR